MTTRRQRGAELSADALEIALQVAHDGGPHEDPYVRTAGLLRPDVPIREGQRARTKERAMLAFHAVHGGETIMPPAEDLRAHTAEVEHRDGMIRMADIERIGPERASEVAARIEEAAGLERAWDQDR